MKRSFAGLSSTQNAAEMYHRPCVFLDLYLATLQIQSPHLKSYALTARSSACRPSLWCTLRHLLKGSALQLTDGECSITSIKDLLEGFFVLQSLVPGLKRNFDDEQLLGHFTLFWALLWVPVATVLNKTFFSHRTLILMEEKELLSRSTKKQLVVMVFY